MEKLPAAILDAKYIDLIGLACFLRKEGDAATTNDESHMNEEKLAKAMFERAAGEIWEV